MPRKRKRTVEPIGPTNVPGEPLDPKLPEEPVESEPVESEEEQQARESEKTFDRALNRVPPG
jgi:DNA-directed RNA polymerase specialized sigma24 family protein